MTLQDISTSDLEFDYCNYGQKLFKYVKISHIFINLAMSYST